jgi:deoxyribodipyrimidine photo-lyase
MSTPAIVWFRQDLRLADNPALAAALKRGGAIIPVYIWAPEEEGQWPPGGASKWWLLHSLSQLSTALGDCGSKLVLRRGPSLPALEHLVTQTGATAVFWNRRYEPRIRERDKQIKEALKDRGIEAESFNAALLHEPWTVQNKSGKPFQVFTPFWRHCLQLAEPAAPLAAPKGIPAPKKWPSSESLETFELQPKPDWAGGLRETWEPGTAGARKHLHRFVKGAFATYSDDRNLPHVTGTSLLSPHLHFGEISPRHVWHALKQHAFTKDASKSWVNSQYVSELGWREFSHHLLYHFPHTVNKPLRAEFENFRWRRNPEWLRAWQKGQTGYPIVDAGMRQLWHTGWMHNRVRMIAASFLVKDLLIDWREGAKWFWDTLVDADLAQNTLGWQWTAGCGADAAPYFRVFNPTSQGEKFDPDGAYVKRWLPELAKLPAKWIHAPDKAPQEILTSAGVEFGKHYPRPIVSHVIAREIALEAYNKARKQ